MSSRRKRTCLEVTITGDFEPDVPGLWIIGSGKTSRFFLVVAAINCLHMPLGTVLGVFTIIVLIRQSVVELYEYSPPPEG